MNARYLLLALVACQCQRHADSEPAPAAAAPRIVADTRLPEDPEAGARSVAEWREHLKEEEHERKLRHDRRKLREHRHVSQLLRATHEQYERAATKQAVNAVHAAFRARLPELEKSFDSLDHYGESSGLVPEYRKLLALFTAAYPDARIAAIGGSRATLDELETQAKAGLELIDDWLKEASEEAD